MINIEQAVNDIEEIFLGSADLAVRPLVASGTNIAFVYLDGLTDKQLLEENIIRPLLKSQNFKAPYEDAFNHETYYSDKVKRFETIDEISKGVAQGDIALIIDGAETFFLINLRKYAQRSIDEPPTENISHGPREGFVEDLKTNVTLLRRRVRSPKLAVHTVNVGRFSNTPVAITYIEGIADPKVIAKVKERVNAIDIDGIIDSTYIAAFLKEHKFSLFSEFSVSEKPDVVTSKLLQGAVAIICDGSPVAVMVPFRLFETLQDSFDYYTNPWRSTMLRYLRLFGMLIATLLPATYVAVQSYHFQLLPMKFLITLIASIEGIPFNPAIETFIVILLFEVLNQASVRMPRLMGISLSIVGAIVLGDTAVKAGIISSPAVLVTALSAIGVFCVPDQVSQISVLRLFFLCISAVLGLFGILMVFIVLFCNLSSINSYGTPYLAPLAPIIIPDLKDSTFSKDGVIGMKKRPYSYPTKNRTRQK